MMTLALLVGLWSTACIQMQDSGKQGFVIETYYFEDTGHYEFSRQWFKNANCQNFLAVDSEVGILQLGLRLQGIFINQETFAADFSSNGGTDLGAIALSGNKLKIARGMKNSSMRNTMLGIFEYIRQ
jgi:hypothetical protein